jgi:CheY-like chemotaxis protein
VTQPNQAADPPPAMPLRILVVDDNTDGAESLGMVLRLAGHTVEVAHDGPTALRMAATQQPHVVVLDIGLPGMDGYEAARRLRQLVGLETARLIAVTGYGQDRDRQAARAAGFDEHYTKPLDPIAFRDNLARLYPLH